MTRVSDTAADAYTQARIRINEAGAHELEDALLAWEQYLLGVRKLMLDEGFTDTIAQLNRRLGSVRRVQEELTRTIGEQGW